jgi:hypothetical protein
MAIRYDAVTKPVTKPRNETPDVTKPSVRLMTPEQAVQFGTPLWAKELVDVTKPLGGYVTTYGPADLLVTALPEGLVLGKPCGGRPPAGTVAMSGAERVRRHRERRRGAVAAS